MKTSCTQWGRKKEKQIQEITEAKSSTYPNTTNFLNWNRINISQIIWVRLAKLQLMHENRKLGFNLNKIKYKKKVPINYQVLVQLPLQQHHLYGKIDATQTLKRFSEPWACMQELLKLETLELLRDLQNKI